MTRIRTAVVPAAGLGTRMRPATLAVPKELLPIGRRPAIDWVIDEAQSAGIERLVVVSGPHKAALDTYLAETRGASHCPFDADMTTVQHRAGGPVVRIVHQAEPRGLGDAVLCGWRVAGDEPVAVLLPDELLLGGPGLLGSLLEVHDRLGSSAVALMAVPMDEIGAYGCAQLLARAREGVVPIRRLLERPNPRRAPSNLAVCGRYVLGLDVRIALRTLRPDERGEIQLTAALDVAASTGSGLLGVPVLPGHGRVDVGNWDGWLLANEETLEPGGGPNGARFLPRLPGGGVQGSGPDPGRGSLTIAA